MDRCEEREWRCVQVRGEEVRSRATRGCSACRLCQQAQSMHCFSLWSTWSSRIRIRDLVAPGRPTPRAQLKVDWRVQEDNNWRPTASDFAHHMHISHYVLRKTSNIFDWYSYQLDIYTTGGWTFWFHDRSGDKYEILAIRNSRHCVKYNSRDPDIIRVSRP